MATGVAPSVSATMIDLNIRIALLLVRSTRMGDGTIYRGPDLLGVLPECTRCMVGRAGLPFGLTFGQLRVGQLYVKCAFHGVDLDDVTILQQPDRATDRCFRPDMADAEAAGSTGGPPVRDESDRAPQALPGQCRRGGQHFAHAGTAARPFIANHNDLALFVGLLLNRLEGVLFPIETTGRTGKFQTRHTRDLHDRAFRREIPR